MISVKSSKSFVAKFNNFVEVNNFILVNEKRHYFVLFIILQYLHKFNNNILYLKNNFNLYFILLNLNLNYFPLFSIFNKSK